MGLLLAGKGPKGTKGYGASLEVIEEGDGGGILKILESRALGYII